MYVCDHTKAVCCTGRRRTRQQQAGGRKEKVAVVGKYLQSVCEYDTEGDVVWNMAATVPVEEEEDAAENGTILSTSSVIAYTSPDRLTLLRLEIEQEGEGESKKRHDDDNDDDDRGGGGDDENASGVAIKRGPRDSSVSPLPSRITFTRLASADLHRAEKDIGRKVVAVRRQDGGSSGNVWVVTCDDKCNVLVYRYGSTATITQKRERDQDDDSSGGGGSDLALQLHATLEGHKQYVSDVDLHCIEGRGDGGAALRVCSVGEDRTVRVWLVLSNHVDALHNDESQGPSVTQQPLFQLLLSLQMPPTLLQKYPNHELKACRFDDGNNSDGNNDSDPSAALTPIDAPAPPLYILHTARSGPTMLSSVDVTGQCIAETHILRREPCSAMCVRAGIVALGVNDGVVLLERREKKKRLRGSWRQVAEMKRAHSFPVTSIDIVRSDLKGGKDGMLVVSGSIDRSVVVQKLAMKRGWDVSVVQAVLSFFVLLLAVVLYYVLQSQSQ